MKKLKFLIPTLVIALLFTGCGKSPETILKDASDKMKNLENYHMNMDMNMEMSYDGSSMSLSAKIESDIDEKNGISVMDVTTSFFGMTSTERSYVSYKDGKAITYSKEDDTWYKEEKDYEENVNFDIFSNSSNIEKVKDEEGTYKISLTEEQIKELMGTIDEVKDAEIDLNSVDIKVSVKDGYVTKIVMTMPMSTEDDEAKITMNVALTMEFSKFNEVANVSIPEEVLNNAVDMKQYEFQSNVEEYIYTIEWELIDNEDGVTTYTNTDLEYDGPKPSKVELTIEDGRVVNGVIEIDEYSAIITDGKISNLNKIK